ncbi:MAG: nucleotidyltransferase domain-containing protein [Myxococcota bacterium]|nr:nucleotidyltransferase domain-containing protein [Myxococcota bacterium]
MQAPRENRPASNPSDSEAEGRKDSKNADERSDSETLAVSSRALERQASSLQRLGFELLDTLGSLRPHWFGQRCIFLCMHGSHAYGTATPSSDVDVRGVAIAPRELLFGYRGCPEQADKKEPDLVVYELRKFMRLAADCNPNIIELLWVDEAARLFTHPLGERMLEARGLFLSKRARYSFAGYASSQLKRIQTHRKWLLAPPQQEPQRSDFGLPEGVGMSRQDLGAVETMLQEKLDDWDPSAGWDNLEPSQRLAMREHFERILNELLQALGKPSTGLPGEAEVTSTEQALWRAAATQLGFSNRFIDLLQRERQLREARRNWQQYASWKQKRNPARAELERRHGYDTKHAMHLVRLLRMCEEILELGEVRVRRPDAEELLEIRRGAWSYDTLMEWSRQQEARIEALSRSSTRIPEQPNQQALDALCVELHEATADTL